MRNLRAPLALVAAVVLVGACSASSKHSSASSPPSTAPAAPSSTVTSTTLPHSAPLAITTTAPPQGSTATTAVLPPPTVAGPANSAASGAPVAPHPGTYSYRQTGSTTFGATSTPVPATDTLVIDPVAANGDQTWHRYVNPAQQPSDEVFAFRGGGVFLVETVQRMTVAGDTVAYTCTFAAPVPTPPWPVKVGETFTGSANCGSFTLALKGSVPGTENVTLDGATHHVYVVVLDLTLSGQINGTATVSEWADPTTSLIVHEIDTEKVSDGPFTVSSTETADLVSAHPSAA